MPLLRAKEIAYPLGKAKIGLALCDHRLADEMEKARALAPELQSRRLLGRRHARQPRSDDAEARLRALHRLRHRQRRRLPDRLHLRHHRRAEGHDAFPSRHAGDLRQLRPARAARAADRPLHRLAAARLHVRPRRAGAVSAAGRRLDRAAGTRRPRRPARRHRASIAPRSASPRRPPIARCSASSPSTTSRRCSKPVSAGEALPKATFEAWLAATGQRILDGIGATEMLHIFIGSPQDEIRPGSTGRPVPGYEARVVDDDGRELPPGTIGRLAVRGPTGCRYLADKRQQQYVRDGWNITGDTYLMDADGYFWYQARSDDMIVSAGYNIAGPEVESALLAHPAVAECGVVGAPDADRGQIVKAYVVLRPGHAGDAAMTKALAGLRQGNDRALQVSARHRIRDDAAAHADRQAAALRTAPHGERQPRANLPPERTRNTPMTTTKSKPIPALFEERDELPRTLQPQGWPRPHGYANGMSARGPRHRHRRHDRLRHHGERGRRLRRAGAACAAQHPRRAGRRRRRPGAHRAAHLVRARHGRVPRRAAGNSAAPIAR